MPFEPARGAPPECRCAADARAAKAQTDRLLVVAQKLVAQGAGGRALDIVNAHGLSPAEVKARAKAAANALYRRGHSNAALAVLDDSRAPATPAPARPTYTEGQLAVAKKLVAQGLGGAALKIVNTHREERERLRLAESNPKPGLPTPPEWALERNPLALAESACQPVPLPRQGWAALYPAPASDLDVDRDTLKSAALGRDLWVFLCQGCLTRRVILPFKSPPGRQPACTCVSHPDARDRLQAWAPIKDKVAGLILNRKAADEVVADHDKATAPAYAGTVRGAWRALYPAPDSGADLEGVRDAVWVYRCGLCQDEVKLMRPRAGGAPPACGKVFPTLPSTPNPRS